MNELGAFDEPGIEMGYLSAQALRAARIVVDIGMHLGYSDVDGTPWDAQSARKLLNEQALLDDAHSLSETDRYLGWPGQAISYKVGERVWMSAREDAKARLGSSFDLKRFHTYALKIGPMGLLNGCKVLGLKRGSGANTYGGIYTCLNSIATNGTWSTTYFHLA